MQHLSTVLKNETKDKMQAIARRMGLNPTRYPARVIEKAVDELYHKMFEENQTSSNSLK